MSIEIIQQRLDSYHCQTLLAEENALKEITQEIALMSLSKANFFKLAEFHGGTALRILYGLPRFSEDLDFALLNNNAEFNWNKYFNIIYDELSAYGYSLELQDRSKTNRNVKQAFLKTNSIGKVLILNHPDIFNANRKIRIKLEIDTNPPMGANSELKVLDFPLPFSVLVQELSSSFAGKIHALLCRKYTKGRDWYDFIWYVSRKTKINLLLLSNALQQVGPWQNKNLHIDYTWVINALRKRIIAMDWRQVRQDVMRFLRPSDQKTLELWSKDFFISYLNRLKNYEAI
ncbi:MAG: nucleotidyl transferase AbiEii/AbiGii toxin family protein [Gammaproteobacteria bacterium]|jgi:predicted nucleotidyltransferase component of viral defense system